MTRNRVRCLGFVAGWMLLCGGCGRTEEVASATAMDGRPAVVEKSASAEFREDLDRIFGEPEASILILGTFHFEDAGLDDYQPEHDIDVMSPERQREVEEIVRRLGEYRPTKIAIEWAPEYQELADERYTKYLRGEFELGPNEVYQLGFRLAKELGHEQVHLVDAQARAYEPWVDIDEYAATHGQEDLIESPWDARFRAFYNAKDEIKVKQSIGDHLILLNSKEAIQASHGAYLVGGFKIGRGDEYPGPDNRTRWYNRNLRIFANLQRITESEDERILLIIGSGHLSILRHAIEASPEYRLVVPAQYLAEN